MTSQSPEFRAYADKIHECWSAEVSEMEVTWVLHEARQPLDRPEGRREFIERIKKLAPLDEPKSRA
jgi:hypothetical protein